MKKSLILAILLSLIIFSFYHENVDGMDNGTKAKVVQEVQLKVEPIKIYNSKNEINITSEVNKTIKEEFSVEIKGDLNTTKETLITLKAMVKNAKNLETCNYFWYEGKELIDMGSTLKKSFDKGDHNITIVVRDENDSEINSSVIVGAYNYEFTTKSHYDVYYGQLLYTERIISNHKGEYILYDDGIYSKELSVYTNADELSERVVEYYLYPQENKKTVFTYDDKGNNIIAQTFNKDGISVNYRLTIFDDNSTVIDMKFGTNAEDIEEDEIKVDDNIVYTPEDYTELNVQEDVIKLNDNGDTLYAEMYYGDTKVVSKMTYNEENKLVKSERTNNSSYDSSTTIMEYDENGNVINTEKKYAMDGHGVCHYRSKSTFTKLGKVKSKVSTLLEGECPYLDIDEVKRVYSYDEDGNIINVKAMTDDENLSEAYSTLKVIKKYINELDI